MKKQNNYFEIIVGTFVLLCAIFFFANSYKSARISDGKGGYYLTAKFDNIGDISSGSDIKISGVKVGTVEEQALDESNYRALLKLRISDSIKLPIDSSVKVSSEGLLGSKFLSIEPGGDDEILQEGEEIKFTQSSVNFEELLGKFIFGSGNDKKK